MPREGRRDKAIAISEALTRSIAVKAVLDAC